MAKTFNRTIIIGRLGEKPELKKMKSDMDYCRFWISNSTFQDGQEIVQWHEIMTVGKQARVCAEHLDKGDLCCIEGRLDRKTFMKDGEEKYMQLIIAERITFLSKARKKEEEHANEPETVNEQVAE